MVQDVARVQRATVALDEISIKEGIEQLVGSPVECCSEYTSKIVGRPAPRETKVQGSQFQLLQRSRGVVHPLVGAIHQAYQDHRSLVLSPDMFWLLVTQGLAVHVNNNPDEFRETFRVGQEGELIEVRHDSLYKGSPENPWEDVFDDFCQEIESRIGQENYSQIVTAFSTTGRVERVANAITLMDCVKSYFQFGLRSRCGIPQVVLEGSAGDWERVRDSTESLGETYALSWWTKRLLPVLDRVARNAAGEDDPELWQSLYKQVDGSGGPYISGWIADFFPYVGRDQTKSRNPAFGDVPRPSEWEQEPWAWCITTDVLPSPVSKAPFTWFYEDREFNMELFAGFIGFTQDSETLRLRPKIGWAVRGSS